jgi:hypothetical protein
MIEKKPDSFSDIVDRAVAELRSTPVPPGPPPELLDALLQAASVSDKQLSVASYNQPLSQLQKIRNIIMKYPFKSITTFTACCLILIAAYLIAGPLMHGSVAFAEVSAIIQKAKTMVCTGHMNLPELGPSDMSKIKMEDLGNGQMRVNLPATGNTKIKIMSLDNGRTRQETGSQITICDWKAGKSLTLSPETKTAILTNMSGMPSMFQQDWLASLKKMTQIPNAEDLGTKTMDSKEVKGFRIKADGMTFTLWADPKSGDPVTVETQQKIPDYTNLEIKDGNLKTGGERNFEMVLSNFQFDVPLDESLFSLIPPEGYKLQEMSMDWSGASERDVIEVLRRAADMDNGAFPDALRDQTLIMKMTMKMSFDMAKQAAMERAKEKNAKAELSPEILKKASETGNLMGRFVMFLNENEGWKYAGKGLKLGEANRPIFWYVPKDSKQGRVIYGDLNIKEVPIDQLPPDPDTKINDTK